MGDQETAGRLRRLSSTSQWEAAVAVAGVRVRAGVVFKQLRDYTVQMQQPRSAIAAPMAQAAVNDVYNPALQKESLMGSVNTYKLKPCADASHTPQN